MKTKILNILKPKIASLGFSKEEREDVVTHIVSNLSVAEDASDEEINAAITTSVDAVIPMLRLSQSVSSRIVNDYKTKAGKKPTPSGGNEGGSGGQENKGDEMPDWFKKYSDKQDARFAELEQKNRDKSYSEQLAERLKDVNTSFYGLAAKGRSFSNDEEFEAFIVEVETSWNEFNQGVANDSLSGGFKPKGSSGESKSDVESFAKIINDGTSAIVEQQK